MADAIAGDESTLLDSLAESRDLGSPRMPGALSVSSLRSLPLPLQRRAVHNWLKQNSIPRISFEKIEECLTLLDPDDGPAKINLPGGFHARRRSGAIFIE